MMKIGVQKVMDFKSDLLHSGDPKVFIYERGIGRQRIPRLLRCNESTAILQRSSLEMVLLYFAKEENRETRKTRHAEYFGTRPEIV